MRKFLIVLVIVCLNLGCKAEQKVEQQEEKTQVTPFVWEGANLYFLLTDRFNNGDKANDVNFDRTKETAVLRGFKGGDLKGITEKIESGYFNDLGINAIWMTPIVEQVHGSVNEGSGVTYGFHGYWTKDWTAIDPNYGTKADLKALVEAAHKNGIRILLDAVINHTGPVTDKDAVWPEEWVRENPTCKFTNYENTVTCALVRNLPDIKTESNDAVDLPPQLVEKWKKEGRYEEEVAELDAFFKRTGHPRAPRFYIMKWLTDYITEYGIDGYRVDTVKHTEEYVWQEFRKACDYAFAEWKQNNANAVLDDNAFYLVGEVYNYGISGGTIYDYSDKKVNYFDDAFNSLINFEFKWNAAQRTYEQQFKRYDSILNTSLKGYGTFNYLSSHDDGQPFDKDRVKPYETATRLLLAPGTAQVYYGDESARDLTIEGTVGDATLRSFMNWEDLETNAETKAIFKHWKTLGQFRKNHPAVGAGRHQMLQQEPYVFKRTYKTETFNDVVVMGLNMNKGKKEINIASTFKDGTVLRDFYSNQTAKVEKGSVSITSEFDIVLLEKTN